MENTDRSKIKTGVGFANHIPDAIKNLNSSLEMAVRDNDEIEEKESLLEEIE